MSIEAAVHEYAEALDVDARRWEMRHGEASKASAEASKRGDIRECAQQGSLATGYAAAAVACRTHACGLRKLLLEHT